MRDLSLHILDLMENSIRAGAGAIAVTVAVEPDQGTLEIVVEDDGPGLKVAPEVALDPFYTTKDGKRVGLGLSLFREAVEAVDGMLTLEKSELGGLKVRGVMALRHVDRRPLGDLAATLSSVICTNPHLDLTCRLRVGKCEAIVRTADVLSEITAEERGGLAVARRLSQRIHSALATVGLTDAVADMPSAVSAFSGRRCT